MGAIAAQTRQADPYAITPVNTGTSDRPNLQNCTAAANTQMNQCNHPRTDLGYEAHRACMVWEAKRNWHVEPG